MASAYHLPRSAPFSPPPSPTQENNNPRQELVPGHVCVGSIVWLPPLNPLHAPVSCSKSTCTHEIMDEKGYDHPVVILKIRQRENSMTSGDLVLTVALMSTFRNTTLEKYKERQSRDARCLMSIPVQMSSPIDSHTPSAFVPKPGFLHLERRGLKKQGYVRYDHTFDIPVAQLRTYGYQRSCVYHYRLAEESYGVLMEKLEMRREVYEKTNTLFETARGRLAALVLTQGIATARQQRRQVVPSVAFTRGMERQPLLPVVEATYHRHRLPVYVHRYSPRVSDPNEGTEGGWRNFALSVAVLTAVGLFAWSYFG